MSYTPPMPEITPKARIARVGTALVDFATNTVTRPEMEPVRLSPKAAQVLVLLLSQADRPVHREQLMEQVWPGQFRTDDVVTKIIQELRRGLSDASQSTVIETIPRIGYWLKLTVEWVEAQVDSMPRAALDETFSAASAENEPGNETPTAVPAANVSGAQIPPQIRALPWRLYSLAGLVIGLVLVALPLARQIPPSNVAGVQTQPSLANAVVAPRLNVGPVSTDPGDEAHAAISPDGLLLAISAKGLGEPNYRLRLRDVTGSGERYLLDPGQGDELAPVWSRDGSQLVYFRVGEEECSLEITDAQGLRGRKLTTCVAGMIRPAEFLPDGSALLMPWVALPDRPSNAGFAQIDLTDGAVSNFDLGRPPQGLEVEARFSPDGSQLLVQRGMPPFSALSLYDLSNGQRQAPTELGERFNLISGMTWLADNRHALIASDREGLMELWRVDTVTSVIERFGGLAGQFPNAARTQDAVVFVHLDRPSGLFLLAGQLADQVDRTHAPPSVFASTRSETEPAITADGSQLAFVSDRMGSAQIYLGDIGSGQVRMITDFESGRPADLSFSGDGRKIAYSLRLDAEIDAQIIDVASKVITRPTLGMARTIDLRFAALPHQMLYASWDETGNPRIYTEHLGEPSSARSLSSCYGRAPRSGADGWVYFIATGQRRLVRVRESGSEQACELVSDRVAWINRNSWAMVDDGLLAILTPRDRVARAGLYRLTEPPELLVELTQLSRGPLASGVALAGNGRSLIAALPESNNADIWLIRGVSDQH